MEFNQHLFFESIWVGFNQHLFFESFWVGFNQHLLIEWDLINTCSWRPPVPSVCGEPSRSLRWGERSDCPPPRWPLSGRTPPSCSEERLPGFVYSPPGSAQFLWTQVCPVKKNVHQLSSIQVSHINKKCLRDLNASLVQNLKGLHMYNELSTL